MASPSPGRSRSSEIVSSSADYDADNAERYGPLNHALPDADLSAFVDDLGRIESSDRRPDGPRPSPASTPRPDCPPRPG
jgi:hypothetical protein